MSNFNSSLSAQEIEDALIKAQSSLNTEEVEALIPPSPQAPTISVGTVTTGNPGTEASITESGTEQDKIFNFVIPRGDKGEPGTSTGEGGVLPGIFNVNMYDDRVHTLTTAIAVAYSYLGAKKGVIISYRVSADSVTPTVFETKVATYGKTMNEANFKNEAYWVDYVSTLIDTSEFLTYKIGYTEKTIINTTAGQKLNNLNGLIITTGQSGGNLLEYSVKAGEEIRVVVDHKTYSNELHSAFYDSANVPISPYDLYKCDAGITVHTIIAPENAVKMYVYTNNIINTFVGSLTAESVLYKNTLSSEPITLTDLIPIGGYSGVKIEPIETFSGYKISDLPSNEGELVADSRAIVRKYPNTYIHFGGVGVTFAHSVCAYKKDGTLLKVVYPKHATGADGGKPYSFTYAPVFNAEYVMITQEAGKDNLATYADFSYKSKVPNQEFNPMPTKQTGLKVLCIGNSFSDDAFQRIPNILRQANILDSTLAYTFISGGTLENFYDLMISGDELIRLNISRNSADFFSTPSATYSLQTILELEKWDIIVLQQRSVLSGDPTSFQPYMSGLIEYIKTIVKNRKLCLMFHQVWAGTESYVGIPTEERYQEIVNATKQMIADSGMPYIIPCGTAIQMARRNGTITTINDWTRDGYHSDTGVGRYLESATWFQYIWGYINDLDIRDYNSFRIDITDGNGTSVTDENIDLLNSIAFDAVNVRFLK